MEYDIRVTKPEAPPVKKLSNLALTALEIEKEDALSAGALTFMGAPFVQCSLPHSRQKGVEYERTNGHLTLSVLTPSALGLPWGRYPRLVLAWVTAEAVRTQNPHLELGSSLSSFLSELGLPVTGGKRGTLGRFKSQTMSLFGSTISLIDGAIEKGKHQGRGARIAEREQLWWDPLNPDQETLWNSWVKLSPLIYQTLIERPVPLDMRALKALRSPLALDLYAWCSYRASYLQDPREVPWELLELQFGSSYGETKKFRYECLRKLKQVLTIYPDLRVSEGKGGLILKPSPPHVRKLR